MFQSVKNLFTRGRPAYEQPLPLQRPERGMGPDQRAEARPDALMWANHEYPHLAQMTHGKHMADGVFICCHCGTENELRHYLGNHPLKLVTCRRCDRTYCKECKSSAILTPFPAAVLLQSTRYAKSLKERSARLCSNCGLTHRRGSSGFSSRCSCGVRPSAEDITFALLPPDSYQRDPEGITVQLRVDTQLAKALPAKPVQVVRGVERNPTPNTDLPRPQNTVPQRQHAIRRQHSPRQSRPRVDSARQPRIDRSERREWD